MKLWWALHMNCHEGALLLNKKCQITHTMVYRASRTPVAILHITANYVLPLKQRSLTTSIQKRRGARLTHIVSKHSLLLYLNLAGEDFEDRWKSTLTYMLYTNQKYFNSIDYLPGSMAAEIRDCASRTRFMASSISLLEVSDFRLGETRPAATWFSLEQRNTSSCIYRYIQSKTIFCVFSTTCILL